MHDVLAVKNMSDLVLKEICGKYERKNLQKMKLKNVK